MVDITLLGTAATMPLPDRALSSALLRCGGRTILFDCGEGTQTAARRARASLMKTDLIALTHYHGDHIFGLPGLLQTMNCLGRREPLFITGPGDIAAALSPVLRLAGVLAYDVRLVPAGRITLRELNTAWPDGAALASFPTEHRTESQGYLFSLARPAKFDPEKARALSVPVKYWRDLQRGGEVWVNGRLIRSEAVTGQPRKGLRIVFSGDTAPCSGLALIARDADLLICDGTYGSDEQSELAALYGHSTFPQAAKLAAESCVKRLWLTHFSQTVSPEECLSNALAYFPGAECGYDGKTLCLGFDDVND